MKKNIPNILTVFRMLSVPAILYIMFAFDVTESWILLWGAGSLFFIAVLTDAFDGHIARKYNLVSDFGKFLDPIADKFLVLSVMIGFFAIDPAAPTNILFPILIMILREFLITILRMFAVKCSKKHIAIMITVFSITTLAILSMLFLVGMKNIFVMKMAGGIIVAMLAIGFTLSSYYLNTSKQGVVLAANIWGKVKTVIQVVSLLVYFLMFTIKFPLVGYTALWIAAVVTFISGVVYTKEYSKYIAKKS